jgi:hypothetical protein
VKKPISDGRIAATVLVVLVVGIGIGVAGWNIGQRVFTCTVYSTQSSMQMSVRGLHSRSACDQFVAATTFTTTAPDGPTGAHVVCETDNGGLHYTVRDTGLGLVGQAACDLLRSHTYTN